MIRTVTARGLVCPIAKRQFSNTDALATNQRKNLSLFGPPGSGKGSYGKHFARILGVPLITVSDLLRQHRPDLVHTLQQGKLVDDSVVAVTVHEGLLRQKEGYILDGYPRTLEQIALMEDTWDPCLQISSVVHLDVPDHVCETKLLGRRNCSKCGSSYNVNGVFRDGWDLPPQLPKDGDTCDSTATTCDWEIRRDDDTPPIVRDRLAVYHEHADPILEYFQSHPERYRVLTLKPYRGFDDLPELIQTLQSHVEQQQQQQQGQQAASQQR